jgi:hypothetical protein
MLWAGILKVGCLYTSDAVLTSAPTNIFVVTNAATNILVVTNAATTAPTFAECGVSQSAHRT